MGKWVTKILLHPLFRFTFWSVLAVWLVINGVFNTGLISWINYFMAIVSIAQVITNAEESIAYFRNKDDE